MTVVRTALFSLFLLLSASAASAIDLTGYWSGDWKSCTSGHKGPLSAQFCKVSEKCYEVRFKGRFFKVIPFRYAVTLEVVEETADRVTLSGSQSLGRLFGTFTYFATVTDDCFVATYTSCKDNGEFRLTRCTRPCVESCEPATTAAPTATEAQPTPAPAP